MVSRIKMPALSPTMTEGNVSRWLLKVGDRVETGDVLLEIETDKATMEVESTEEGTLGMITVPEGTSDVPVNSVIGWLLAEGETQDQIPPESLDTQSGGSDGDLEQAAAQESVSASRREGANGLATQQEALPDGPTVPALPVRFDGPVVSLAQRDAIRDALAEEMERDDRVIVMGEEVAEYQGAYKATQGLLERFGDRRVIDTPISEYGFTGVGIGAAFVGVRPVVEFMTFNFAMQAIDHIMGAAKMRYMSGGQLSVPIVFRGPNGRAAQVAAQHSQCYASWYAHVPGLKVVAPFCSADAKGLLKSAIRDDDPVIVLEHELLYGQMSDVPDIQADPSLVDHLVPIGRACVRRQGSDVTLIAYSAQVQSVLDAADTLQEQGISADVIDLRTLRPLDSETVLASVRKTNRVVVAEEGWGYANIGAEVASMIGEQAFDDLDAPVARLFGADVPMPYASSLEQLALVHAKDVVAAARRVCYL